jgi:hypothetical protein
MPCDISDCLRRQGFQAISDIEYVSEESVNKWIDNGAIPQENMDEIRELYFLSDEEFKRIHNVRFTDDDIFDDMLLVIARPESKASPTWQVRSLSLVQNVPAPICCA